MADGAAVVAAAAAAADVDASSAQIRMTLVKLMSLRILNQNDYGEIKYFPPSDLCRYGTRFNFMKQIHNYYFNFYL